MDHNVQQHFEIMDNFKKIIRSTWESTRAADFRECILFVDDFSIWVECLIDTPQSILFSSALNECATANLFCSQGLYKHAMISLRLCMEHCLFGIYMSSNDFYFRRWKSGQEDMKWASIIDQDKGIFSKAFIRAYAPEFEERSTELRTIAMDVYRECSEYIHGNFSKLNCLPGQGIFDEEMLSQYISRFNTISYLISVSLVIRFKEYIISTDDLLNKLESAIMNNIELLPEIQLMYGRDEE